MTALDAAALVTLLALGFHLLVGHHLQKLDDPAYLRAHGVVIVSLRAIDAHGEAIGDYRGQPIWATLTFKGMRYAFDRIVPPAERERIGPGELYVEPGMVFRALNS